MLGDESGEAGRGSGHRKIYRPCLGTWIYLKARRSHGRVGRALSKQVTWSDKHFKYIIRCVQNSRWVMPDTGSIIIVVQGKKSVRALTRKSGNRTERKKQGKYLESVTVMIQGRKDWKG